MCVLHRRRPRRLLRLLRALAGLRSPAGTEASACAARHRGSLPPLPGAAPTTRRPTCDAVGFRVAREDDLDTAAARIFSAQGVATEWVERQGQGPHAAVSTDLGNAGRVRPPAMEPQPRVLTDYPVAQGRPGVAARPRPGDRAATWRRRGGFLDLGFRASEVIVDARRAADGMFLHRKNNPHDLVLAHRRRAAAAPLRLSSPPDLQAMFRACRHRRQPRCGTRGGARAGTARSRQRRLRLLPRPGRAPAGADPAADAVHGRRGAADAGLVDAPRRAGSSPGASPRRSAGARRRRTFTGVPLSAEGTCARWVST